MMSSDQLLAAWLFLIPVAFVLLVYGIASLVTFFVGRPNAPEKVDNPMIAYKRAELLPPTLRKRSHDFAGVVGQTYGVVDKATSVLGFHAYDDFSRARKHPQEGNVFLEVVLSGAVQEHDLGWTATNQRVLQVIPHCCFGVIGGTCKLRPTRYFVAGDKLYFRCSIHAFDAGLLALVKLAPLEPIAGLAARYENFEDHNVVVSFESGSDRFIPTELPEQPKSVS